MLRSSPSPITLVALHAAEAEPCAVHAIDISADEAPGWVHLIPAGRFKGVDGRGPYNLSDIKAVIAASLDGRRPLPLDYAHANDLQAPAGRPATAAGWIEALEDRAHGIGGRGTRTPHGAQALTNREDRVQPTTL